MAEDKQILQDNQGDRDRDRDWNELNELTLSVMSNRTRYDKYKKTVSNASDALIEQFCKEKMYYKERIMAMTRDLFDERCENDDINRAHEEYVKSCIEYLKWCDITEMVGEDQRTEVKEDIQNARQELQQKIQETPLILQTEEPNETTAEPEPEPEPTAPTPGSTITGRIMSFANKMCIRKKTMDDFIVMKPIPGNTDEEINARLPKVRDYQHEIMKRASASASAHCD
jgi:hypothetical protein